MVDCRCAHTALSIGLHSSTVARATVAVRLRNSVEYLVGPPDLISLPTARWTRL
jgi:hypothetical protein